MTDTTVPDPPRDVAAGVGADWVPDGWQHPLSAVPAPGFRLRPIRATDVDLDLAAVRGSRERLWTIFGAAWNWPPADLTREQDLAQLGLHEAEHLAHESFTYALLDEAEQRILGCLYVDPPGRLGADAEVSWWVVDELVGTDLARAVDAFVPAWIGTEWPFEQPRFLGLDLTWDEWLTLPEIGAGR